MRKLTKSRNQKNSKKLTKRKVMKGCGSNLNFSAFSFKGMASNNSATMQKYLRNQSSLKERNAAIETANPKILATQPSVVNGKIYSRKTVAATKSKPSANAVFESRFGFKPVRSAAEKAGYIKKKK